MAKLIRRKTLPSMHVQRLQMLKGKGTSYSNECSTACPSFLMLFSFVWEIHWLGNAVLSAYHLSAVANKIDNWSYVQKQLLHSALLVSFHPSGSVVTSLFFMYIYFYCTHMCIKTRFCFEVIYTGTSSVIDHQ